MPGPTTRITAREKAAVFLYAAGIETSWKEIYLIAEDKKRSDAEQIKDLTTLISRWKNSDKIKNALEESRRILAARDLEQRRQGAEEERRRQEEKQNEQGDNKQTTGHKAGQTAKNIDFYDPANQRTQINKIIQEASDDPKTQLDAIKAIQQTQRDDRQAARDQKQARFYLPIRCQSCPLYSKAAKNTTK